MLNVQNDGAQVPIVAVNAECMSCNVWGHSHGKLLILASSGSCMNVTRSHCTSFCDAPCGVGR